MLFVSVDPLSGQILGRRELRHRDLSVPAAVKSKSFIIIYDDELGSFPPLAYIIHFQQSDLLVETTHSSGEGQIVEKILCQSLFIISCLLSHFMFKDKGEKSGQSVKRKISKLMNMIHSEAVDVI